MSTDVQLPDGRWVEIETVRSDMGDGGWSIHVRRPDVDEQEDPVGAWPLLLSGESGCDAEGDWLRPNEADWSRALELAQDELDRAD